MNLFYLFDTMKIIPRENYIKIHTDDQFAFSPLKITAVTERYSQNLDTLTELSSLYPSQMDVIHSFNVQWK